ncbi:MAG: hypothetical protein KF764_00970 [Labilithrix sp.]|nr:hypothetical protein [Labilithrix sp.]
MSFASDSSNLLAAAGGERLTSKGAQRLVTLAKEVQPLAAALWFGMAFGKTPLSRAEVQRFRRQWRADERRRRPKDQVLALQPYVEEEIAAFRCSLGTGDDDIHPLLRTSSLTMVMYEALYLTGAIVRDGEAMIEAISAYEALQSGYTFSQPPLRDWASVVTAAPPKRDVAYRREDPFVFALLSALETYLALRLTDGRFDVHRSLTEYLDRHTKKWRNPLARVHEDIVEDFMQGRRLSRKYRPSGNLQAPLAFLKRELRWALDKEKRCVDGYEIRPPWIRAMRLAERLRPGQPVTGAVVEALHAESQSNMTHAPPAGYFISSTIQRALEERKDGGALALAIAAEIENGPPREELLLEVLSSDLSNEIREWLTVPAPKRPPLPDGAVRTNVAISKRSVDQLVIDYEKRRATPFRRAGDKSRLIPVRELDRIIEFANVRAGTAARSTAEPPT